MAHNIWHDSATDTDAMFCVGDRKAAWHELGQRTMDAVTWREAMKLANLDWDVQLQPAYARQPTRMIDGKKIVGQIVELPRKGVFRVTDGACLGTVGVDYGVVQNSQAFNFVDAILGASNGAHYETAGALGNGSRIWCMARIPSADFALANGKDVHQMYLVFTTSHDGTESAVAKLTDTRVVCQNTLNIALSSGGATARFRHSKNVTARMASAQQFIASAVQDAKSLKTRLETLANRRMTRESAVAILDRLFPKPQAGANETRRNSQLAQVLELFERNDNGDGIPEIAGSAYNFLNAITEYADHYRTARLTEARVNDGMTINMARAENAMFGTGDTLKSNALWVIEKETEKVPAMVTGTRQLSAGPSAFSIRDLVNSIGA